MALRWLTLLSLLFTLSSCVKETPFDADNNKNFEALWTIIDENYCFLDEKGVDWNKVHTDYAAKLRSKPHSAVDFFMLMNEMLCELKDGHVNLISSFNTGRYSEWMGDPTEGHNVYHRSKYLGTNYFSSGGMKYVILQIGDTKRTVGYISYPSFSSPLGNMYFILNAMKKCDGIIIDLRGNGGGYVDNADQLVSYFISERKLVGYFSYKTGKGHNDFSPLYPQYISPNEQITVTTQPIVVLQDRGCYSSTNDFLYKIKVAPNVTTIGLKSGGGGGVPAVSELPNGWRVRYSSVRTYDRDKKSVEGGVAPTIEQANVSYEVNPAAPDAIFRAALKHLGF